MTPEDVKDLFNKIIGEYYRLREELYDCKQSNDRLTAANKQLMEVITRLQPISTISFEDWEAVKKAGEEQA